MAETRVTERGETRLTEDGEMRVVEQDVTVFSLAHDLLPQARQDGIAAANALIDMGDMTVRAEVHVKVTAVDWPVLSE